LISAAQSDAQLWNDLLWSSGGRLEIKKSHYKFITYDPGKLGHPVLRQGTDWTAPLVVRNPDGGTTEIRAEDAASDHRSLGCYKGPQGTLRKQLQVIRDRCLYYAKLARSAQFTRQEANMFYRSMFLSSAGFPLPTTYFTEQQLDAAQSPVFSALLPGMGYNRHTVRAVVYGPAEWGGMNL